MFSAFSYRFSDGKKFTLLKKSQVCLGEVARLLSKVTLCNLNLRSGDVRSENVLNQFGISAFSQKTLTCTLSSLHIRGWLGGQFAATWLISLQPICGNESHEGNGMLTHPAEQPTASLPGSLRWCIHCRLKKRGLQQAGNSSRLLIQTVCDV